MALSGVGQGRFDDLQHKFEVNLSLLDADLGSDAADGHGSDAPDLRKRVAECDLEASDDDAQIRQKVVRIADQLDDAADDLTGPGFEVGNSAAHAVVENGNDHRK